MSKQDRGVSPVIAALLMVAVTVILATTISVFTLGIAEDINQPAPNIAQTSGEIVPQDGFSGGIIKITHIAGDSVAIADIEISVRAECIQGSKQGRIVNLPANAIRSGQIEGENIFSGSFLATIDNQVDDVDNGGAIKQGGQYTAGDIIIFRIGSQARCELTQGSEVSVQVVHTPSQAIIIDKDLTA